MLFCARRGIFLGFDAVRSVLTVATGRVTNAFSIMSLKAVSMHDMGDLLLGLLSCCLHLSSQCSHPEI